MCVYVCVCLCVVGFVVKRFDTQHVDIIICNTLLFIYNIFLDCCREFFDHPFLHFVFCWGFFT